jgi:uncharacterized membrane protein
MQRKAYWLVNGSWLGLIALCLLWELWLAPAHGGSWLVLKAIPLLLPLRGLLHGRRYTYQWTSMFIMLYFIEGIVRVWSDRGLSQWLAGVEVVLTVVCFAGLLLYCRATRPSLRVAG